MPELITPQAALLLLYCVAHAAYRPDEWPGKAAVDLVAQVVDIDFDHIRPASRIPWRSARSTDRRGVPRGEPDRAPARRPLADLPRLRQRGDRARAPAPEAPPVRTAWSDSRPHLRPDRGRDRVPRRARSASGWVSAGAVGASRARPPSHPFQAASRPARPDHDHPVRRWSALPARRAPPRRGAQHPSAPARQPVQCGDRLPPTKHPSLQPLPPYASTLASTMLAQPWSNLREGYFSLRKTSANPGRAGIIRAV